MAWHFQYYSFPINPTSYAAISITITITITRTTTTTATYVI